MRRRAAHLARRRLVTLTGPGGVGKTRLAVEAAILVADDFPDGVWMVELAPLTDPDAVEAAVAASLGVVPQDGVPLIQSVLDWLEQRRVLLIVDNCEHLLAAVRHLVTRVLRAVPTATIVATSREPLGLEGEQVVPVPSLATADAVELFCDRAVAIDESLRFGTDDRAMIAAVCNRLDGIPLAVELAAARARSLGLADLLHRLDDRFKLLRGGGRGVERHQTLRATVEWSYQLLSEDERALFDRLSAFGGSFDLRAAEAVCAGGPVDNDDVVHLLAALVDKSLVVVERGSTGVRYRLLETLRQYAEEQLHTRGDGESARARQRHLEHFARVAEEIGEGWADERCEVATRLCYAEWDNFRAAVGTATANADPQRAEPILDGTFGPAMMGLRFEHGEWAEAVAALASEGDRVQPATYGYAASFAWRAAENDRAITLARRGIDAAPSPDEPATVLCWGYLILALVSAGMPSEAVDAAPHLEAAASNAALPLHQLVVSAAFIFLAAVRDPSLLHDLVVRVREIAEAARSPAVRGAALFVLGVALRMPPPGDAAGALAAHTAALHIVERLDATHMIVANRMCIASLKASEATADALAATRATLVESYDARSWPAVLSALVIALNQATLRGDREATSLISGYLETNAQPAVAAISSGMLPLPLPVPDSASILP
ncbi:MAG TPA: AAA family ATPase, partial [Thermoleophilia bacterium]|nr:AAA family ATPase [Thermoleophilia bacterium]